MNDSDRRALFEAWFAGPPMRGDREALIKKSGYTKGRVSHFFDPDQQFGERAARSLASRLGLPDEFFNTPATDASAPPAPAPATGRGALEQALKIIDDALAPLDAADRHSAVRILQDLETPGRASSLASMLFGVIESAPSKRWAA